MGKMGAPLENIHAPLPIIYDSSLITLFKNADIPV
jgi:hypothetical protein